MNAEFNSEVDLLIHARWIIPVIPAGLILENHSIAIRDKKIVCLCSSDYAEETLSAKQVVQLNNHLLIPGLINSHGHAAMSLFRGIADDMPLQQWLEEKIWPLESKFVDKNFVYQGASLAIAEMIRAGTTCFADMYFYPDQVAKSALDANIRVQLASPILDFSTVWAQDAEEYILKATRLHDDYRNNELVHTAFGPHATYTVSDAPLQKISMLAEEMDIPIHIHLHETAREVADSVQAEGRRPLQRLSDLGLLSPRLVCVHATQLTAQDIQMLAESGAHVIHCPQSNLKLASGFCEVAKLFEAGVNVGLGTDGCPSNNDLDMISEIRTAALIGKAVANDASAIPALQALEMATINGARAMGLDNLIGSLEPEKFADITAIDMDEFNCLPMYNPVSQLVYSTQASQVSHVWCGGQLLLENGELRSLDSELIKATARQWQQQILEA